MKEFIGYLKHDKVSRNMIIGILICALLLALESSIIIKYPETEFLFTCRAENSIILPFDTSGHYCTYDDISNYLEGNAPWKHHYK